MKFGELGWDVHSHLVPGVDDGAFKTLKNPSNMVAGMVDMGYRGMVLTPHIMATLPQLARLTLVPSKSWQQRSRRQHGPNGAQAGRGTSSTSTLRIVQAANDVMTFHAVDELDQPAGAVVGVWLSPRTTMNVGEGGHF